MSISSNFRLIYYITIALTGLVGNTTTIIVFSQRRLRSLRSSFFLTCLAITDLIFIIILVVVLLDDLQLPVMTSRVCILTIYLSHIASFLSSNFTLAYTVHRLIAVFFPIKATTFLKQRTNRILAFILVLFSSMFYSLAFHVTKTIPRSNTTNTVDCEEDRNIPLLYPFLILDTIFTFIIPFSCIACMNLAIVYKLHSTLAYMQNTPAPTTTSPIQNSATKSLLNCSVQSIIDGIPLSQLNKNNFNNSTNTLNSSQNNGNIETNCLLEQQDKYYLCVKSFQIDSRRERRCNQNENCALSRSLSQYQRNSPIRIRSTQSRTSTSAKTTKMLLAASTVFLVFNLPYHLLLFCFLLMSKQPSWMTPAVNIARLWFFASFCVNFFVYAICGQRFRKEVVRLFSCSFVRHYLTLFDRKKLKDRQNSIYLSHRLLPVSSTHLSQAN